MFTNKINRVAIVGSTHGNEMIGKYLVEKYERFPELVQRKTIDTTTLLANPRAFNIGKRYLHKDLNRCFMEKDLNNPNLKSYEDLRAKEINKLLGNGNVDLIIDLHSTTSDMGMTVILGTENDPLTLNLCAHLTMIDPLIKFYRWSNTSDNSFLRSLSKRNIAIEVGAVAHNTINSKYFDLTEKLIHTILDFLNSSNEKPTIPLLPTIEVFEGKELVDYPRNSDGELTAMIHPELTNYQALNPGVPLFITFEGKIIPYKNRSTVYPVFLGEASYQEKNIAMVLCSKEEINLKTDSVD